MQEEVKDDPGVPRLIPCQACFKGVSKSGEICPNCSHPIVNSVDGYMAYRKRDKEWARIRADKERYRKVIAEAITIYDDMPAGYTGWVKTTHPNGQLAWLTQYKDGKMDGMQISHHEYGTEVVRYAYRAGRQVHGKIFD